MSRQFAARRLLCLILLCFTAGQPPSAAEASAAPDPAIARLSEALAIAPGDDGMRFELARILARKQHYPEALAEYDVLVRQHPQNVDYSFGRAQVLAWMGGDAEALTELERAMVLAPDYEDVRKLHIAITQRQQEPDAEAEQELRWLLTIGGTYESLSAGLPDWSNQFVEVSWQRSADSRYFSRLIRDERFDQSDTQFAAGAEWQLPAAWFAGLELATTDNPSFQPNNGVAAHIGRPLAKGWGMDFRWAQKRYNTATVSTYTGLVEKYFGNYRAAYSLNASRLHGEQTSYAHLLALNWYMTDRTSFGIVAAAGEEAEVIVPGQILQTDVASVTLSGRHQLNRRTTLRWWAGTHEQGDFYRRRYVGMAVSVGL